VKFIVQELTRKGWLTVDRHDGSKPEPRLFDSREVAEQWAAGRFANKFRILPSA
jgi:hypothetical protein